MSWLSELEQVYDRTISNPASAPDPIYHVRNNCSVTITISSDGNFISAEPVDRADRATCMPCTESCASRSSGSDPYPLADKLDYIGGDGEKFRRYSSLVTSWADSEYGNIKIKAVSTYIRKKTVSADIVSSGISLDDISDFIRWRVGNCDLWRDTECQDSWTAFYNSEAYDGYCRATYPKDAESRIRMTALNYANGKVEKIAVYHPMKIRNGGDRAKLISSNDTVNFTFRGRFGTDMEICKIGSDTTQKAHSALRWLVKKQGVSIGDSLTVVAWNSAGTYMPSITASSSELDDDYAALFGGGDTETYTTSKQFADNLNKNLAGFYGDISNPQNIMVMAIKEATPGQGRAAVALYRMLQNSQMIELLEDWHKGTSWHICYWHKGKDEEKGRYIYSIGSPSPTDIAMCAYGERVKPCLVEKTVQRILPCIIDRARIPEDIVRQCVRSASKLMMLDTDAKRNSTLGTACAVYKYNRWYDTKEVYSMALEKERRSRDYLYGRLLAVAQHLETQALRKMGTERETNAVRYMHQFSLRPCQTWKVLYEKFPSYKKHVDQRLMSWLESIIQDITDMFDTDEYVSNRPLTGEYLLGYQCQLKDFWAKKDSKESDINE